MARRNLFPTLVDDIKQAMVKKSTPIHVFVGLGKSLAKVLMKCCVTLEHALLLALKPWDNMELASLFSAKTAAGVPTGESIMQEVHALLDANGGNPQHRVSKLRSGLEDELDEVFQWRSNATARQIRASGNTMHPGVLYPGFGMMDELAVSTRSSPAGDLTHWLSVLGVADTEIEDPELDNLSRTHPLARMIASLRLTKATQYENSFFWMERLGVSH